MVCKKLEIPKCLTDYIEVYCGGKELIQKKEFPESLKEDLERFRILFNETYNIPSWASLPIIPIERAWEYEIVPIPEYLSQYFDYVEEYYVMRIVHFKNIPNELQGELKKYKREEKKLNRKKDRRHYDESYANEMCWLQYKLEQLFMPRF